MTMKKQENCFPIRWEIIQVSCGLFLWETAGNSSFSNVWRMIKTRCERKFEIFPLVFLNFRIIMGNGEKTTKMRNSFPFTKCCNFLCCVKTSRRAQQHTASNLQRGIERFLVGKRENLSVEQGKGKKPIAMKIIKRVWLSAQAKLASYNWKVLAEDKWKF